MAGYCHSWAPCPLLGAFVILYVPLIYLQLSGVGFEKTRAAVLLEGHPGQRCKAQIPQEQRITPHEWSLAISCKKTQMSPTFLSTQGHYLIVIVVCHHWDVHWSCKSRARRSPVVFFFPFFPLLLLLLLFLSSTQCGCPQEWKTNKRARVQTLRKTRSPDILTNEYCGV